jgi:glucokinase
VNIILDIGGTKTRIGIVNDSFKLLDTEILETAANYSDGIKNIFDFVASKDFRISNVIIGIAGVMDSGVLYSSPNLKGWLGKTLKYDFEKEFKAKIYLENDAALAGLGEAVYGAGKDYKIVSYLTIGTGVGGARIINKCIDERVYGFEPGHMVFISKEKSKTSQASFESLISGKSIKRIYSNEPEDITDKKIWDEIIKNAAIGISNTIYFWNPDIFVLGGGVAMSELFEVALLKKEVEKILIKTYPKIPEIKKSALGDFGGIWGGIAYLKSNI